MMSRLGRLNRKETALFLCDMQEKFRHNIQFFPEIVSVSNRLLQAARILEVPVIVTEQYPKGLGHTALELGLADYPDIKPIEKTQFSMCTEDVMPHIKSDIKSVILTGIEAHVCVQGTCLDLLHKGFEVHVVADAISSRTQVDRKFAIDRMRWAGAYITTSESVILGLLGGSGDPKFRQVQKLILESAPDSGLLTL